MRSQIIYLNTWLADGYISNDKGHGCSNQWWSLVWVISFETNLLSITHRTCFEKIFEGKQVHVSEPWPLDSHQMYTLYILWRWHLGLLVNYLVWPHVHKGYITVLQCEVWYTGIRMHFTVTLIVIHMSMFDLLAHLCRNAYLAQLHQLTSSKAGLLLSFWFKVGMQHNMFQWYLCELQFIAKYQ